MGGDQGIQLYRIGMECNKGKESVRILKPDDKDGKKEPGDSKDRRITCEE